MIGWRGSLALSVVFSEPAVAQSMAAIGRQITHMQHELQSQRRLIEDQSLRIAQQQQEIEHLRTQAQAGLMLPDTTRKLDHVLPPRSAMIAASPDPVPDRSSGDTPRSAKIEQRASAVPEGAAVLSRPGRLVLEPSQEYTNSSSNRLVFRGIELIPGIQIGQIEASAANRDTLVSTITARYGVTRNLEIETRIPYLIRSDRVAALQQRLDETAQRSRLNGSGIGDVEIGLRYQLSRSIGSRPIFVGSFRVKTDTGRSPFSVPFDSSGVASGLATGSGFWAVQPGLSFLLPSDPAVVFGGVSFLYAIPRNVNRTVGGVVIGRVHPGNAISGNIGFGFALNPSFSFSLGYEHTYIFPMRWEINNLIDRQTRLQVGSLVFGMAYQLSPRQALNLGVGLGATQDAPDVSIVLRMPFAL